METKPLFNLYLTYEDALVGAKAFQANYKIVTGEDLSIWEDPRNYAGGRITFKTEYFYREADFLDDVKEEYEVGTIEIGAKAALFWLIQRCGKYYNPMELGQIIVGVSGLCEDKEVAIFTYLSREDDCMRDFITEKAFQLTEK